LNASETDDRSTEYPVRWNNDAGEAGFLTYKIDIRHSLPNLLISGVCVTGLLAYSCGDSQGVAASKPRTLFPFNPDGHLSEVPILSKDKF